MAVPLPLAVAGSLTATLIGASIFYLLSRVVHLRATTIPISDVSRQTRFVVLLVLIEFSTIATYRAIVRLQDFASSGSSEVVLLLFEILRSTIVILLPLAIIVLFTRQKADSLGLRKTDAWKMIALGLVPASALFLVLVLIAPFAGAGFATLSPSLAYGFIIFLLVGLSEEIVWRGYVQTRLIARTTKVYGWLAASLAFALWHLPVNYLNFGGVAEALVGSLLIQFPVGLAFGYMMIRSQSILPSSIYHLFVNWTPGLFQIPGV